MRCSSSLSIKSTPSGQKISGVPIRTLGGDVIKIGGNVFEITPEIHKALSSTGHTGKTLKNDVGNL